MLFAHDTDLALIATAALINTGRDEVDTMTTASQLSEYLDEQGYSGRRDGDEAELAAVRKLRERLDTLWSMDVDDVAQEVNDILREADARPYLSRHDHWDWHIHVTDAEAPLADRMAAENAMALIDLIRTGQLGRLKTCAGDGCRSVFVDFSRNRSRRFCSDGGCGNRAHVAAYRRRRAGA
ncbi:CGNR zinc finger domain-containing protein [Williamsia soli]|uniref:CGNR zinc finger domain-containing protein n=1 Tax=Williamsia soli TaxID=364929 RepID=UPI001A9FB2C9|nr:CGNR zinc finger domain-containing protein [Williamsia soli]